MNRKQQGFTLIEIAIVLVIIGLLLGGILKGQELITSARVRNLISQQEIEQLAGNPLDRGDASTNHVTEDTANWTALDPGGDAEMQWHFPVPNSQQVSVRLYFANRYGGTSEVGQRVFDVSIDSSKVLDNFDIAEREMIPLCQDTGTTVVFAASTSACIAVW